MKGEFFMLVQDGDGKWYDDAGGTGSYHYETQDDASKAMGGGGAGGGGAMTGLAGGVFALVVLGPVIAAKLVGLIWGLLLKLGIVGKVITSALMIIAGPLFLALPFAFARPLVRLMSNIGDASWGILIVGTALLASVWYYFWHYDVVKAMGYKVFSHLVGTFAMFFWFGGLGSVLIGFFKGDAVQPVIAVGSLIAGFVYYFIKSRPYAREVERTGSFKFRYIGLAVAVGITALYGVAAVHEEAVEDLQFAQEKAQFAAAVADIGGQTLTVNTATLNLRAEPSANGRVVKTLNRNDTVKATGKYSGVWIPVESGSDRGYVFALSLRLDDKRLGDTLLPFDAATVTPIQLYYEIHYQSQDRDQRAHELPPGSEVTVIGFESAGMREADYARVLISNRDYLMFAEDAENLVPQLNADGTIATLSKDRPPEFDRKTPFQATVTEAITAIIMDGSGNWMSIPLGATVTVNNELGVNGISQASVTYNDRESRIHWRYLKPAE